MTAKRDFKKIVRARQAKTGESYTTARAHVLRAAPAHSTEEAENACTSPVDAIVLKVDQQSARLAVRGEDAPVTFRSESIFGLVPGHIASVAIRKRWTFRGAPYASGEVERAWLDVEGLGLSPLPLTGGELEDLRERYEPFVAPDPYAVRWRKNTAQPRASYEMSPIAWGLFPGEDLEYEPTSEASELKARGEGAAARKLLMQVLCRDLRCIDAHAHLGNWEFDAWPERARLHYEMGIGIAELSLPPSFDGVLLWGHLYNRPYLRCLHGYGLCLWREQRFEEAARVFERMLRLNPNDNQGVRFCLADVNARRAWVDEDHGW